MTLATERVRLGREPTIIVELVVDKCEHDFGVAPCTASAAAGGECYNTRQTCQDFANFSATTESIYFTESLSGLPPGMYPAIKGRVKNSPTIIDPERGLGQRASVSITLSDFQSNDIKHDPYFDTRTYDVSAGTWWGKWLARNRQSYLNRPLKVHVGYLTSPFSWDNFETKEYVIDRIDGPSNKREVKITGKDPLKIIDDKQIPAPTVAETTEEMSAESAEIIAVGDSAQFASSGYLRVDAEIIYYDSMTSSGTVLTFSDVLRGQWGTAIDEHDIDANLQRCFVIDLLNPVEAVESLLDEVGLDSSYRQASSFTDTETRWGFGNEIRTILSEPSKGAKLIAELCYHSQLFVWWDDRVNLIKIQAAAPVESTYVQPSLETELVEDTTVINDDLAAQITRAYMVFAPFDYTELGDNKDYKSAQGVIDGNAENDDFYGVVKTKLVKSRWVASPGTAYAFASRIIAGYSDGLRRYKFTIDARVGDIWLGDVVQVTSPNVQDVDGAPLAIGVRITRAQEDGHQLKLEGVEYTFAGMNLSEYTGDSQAVYDSSSSDDQERYGFYADDSEFLGTANDAAKVYV